MKLARKLILALVIAIFAVMACNAYLRFLSQKRFLAYDSERDLRTTARAMASGIAAVRFHDGEERAQRFLAKVNVLRDEVNFRWVWIDELGVTDFPQGLSAARIAALRRGEPVTFLRAAEDGDRRFMFWPLDIPGTRPAAIELSEPLQRERDFIRTSQLTILLTTIGIVLACTLIVTAVGVLFVGRPMRLLSEKARRVGAGDLSGPLILRQRDEIGELADEINAMCERLADAQERATRETEARIATLEQLRHADRLMTVGQLASGVAHELGTPLNVVSGHARMIGGGDLTTDEIASSADVIAEQTQRMTAIIRQLLDFSRRKGPHLTEVDVKQLVTSTVDMLSPLAEKRNVLLRHSGGEGAIRADGNQMQQAIANLIVNAIQASDAGGTVDVTVGPYAGTADATGARGNGFVEVSIEDTGNGIAPEHLPHIFEPFFTTKDVGDGTGLGLAVTYGIVREHGGWIDVASEPGKGARFAIVLPAVERAQTDARRAVA
jgi:signal transduction histidine kinase